MNNSLQQSRQNLIKIKEGIVLFLVGYIAKDKLVQQNMK